MSARDQRWTSGALVVTFVLAVSSACARDVPPATPVPAAAAAATTAPAAPTLPPRAPTAATAPTLAASAANPYLVKPGEAQTPVKAAWCAISAGFVQMYVARDYNLFAKYGLDVETSQFTDSSAALAALQSGEIDFLFCAAAATIPGIASGVDATIIAAPLVGLPYVMVARPEIHSVQEIKGHKIGINRQGDLDDRLSHAVLQQEEIPADSVQFIPAGGQTERYKALLSGVIDAVNVTPPLEVQARIDGLNVIYSLKTLPMPFIYSAIHTNSKTIRDRPQIAQKFVAAMAESVYYIDQHKEDAEQSIAKQLNITEPAALDSAYQAYAHDYVNQSVDIPTAAVQDSIEYTRSQGTTIARGQAEQIIDQRFAADLQTSGFLERMWGRPIAGKR
jgi:NitT/TauT family transport system substrate-binding protein